MTNTNNTEPICSYEQCLHCHCKDCWTGQIAREQGKEGYDNMMDMLANATVSYPED